MSIYTALFSALGGGLSGLGNYFAAQDERAFSERMQSNSFAQQNAYQAQQYNYNSKLSEQQSKQELANQRQTMMLKASLGGYTTASSAFSRTARVTDPTTVTSGTTNTTGVLQATRNAAFDNLYSNFSREGQTPRIDSSTQHVETSETASGDDGNLMDTSGLQKTITPSKYRTEPEPMDTEHADHLKPSGYNPTPGTSGGTASSHPIVTDDDLAPLKEQLSKPKSPATTSGSGTSSGSGSYKLTDADIDSTDV